MPSRYKPRGQQHMHKGYKLLALGKKRDWKGMLELYEKEGFDRSIDYAMTMSQLAKIRDVDQRDSSFQRFIEGVAEVLETKGMGWMNVRQASNIVHAVGKMFLKTESAKRIVEFVARKENAEMIVNQGQTMEVSCVCWSLAKLDRSDIASPLFAELEKHASWLVEEGDTQTIANVAWSSAKLVMPSPTLFAAIDKHAVWLVEKANPQEIAIIAWACATLKMESPTLFAEVDKHASWLLEKGNLQDLANVAWACGRARVESPLFFAEVEKHASNLVQKGSPQNVANTVWACGMLKVQPPKLFAEIDKHAPKLVLDWTPQHLANVLLAVSKLQYHTPILFREADRRGAWLVREGNPKDACDCALAFAKVGYVADTFFAALSACASKIPGDWDEQSLCNTCYALAVLDLTNKHKDAVVRLWQSAISWDQDKISQDSLQQLAQIHVLSDASGVKLGRPPEPLRQKIRAIRSDECMSKSQRVLSSMLHELGIAHEEEVSPLPAGESFLPECMLDIDLASREHMIAIEFDGPHHFLRSPGTGEVTRHENGPTRAKRRFLERLGWTVINFHTLDWEDTPYQLRLSRLRNKLEAVGFRFDGVKATHIREDKAGDNAERPRERKDSAQQGSKNFAAKDILEDQPRSERKAPAHQGSKSASKGILEDQDPSDDDEWKVVAPKGRGSKKR